MGTMTEDGVSFSFLISTLLTHMLLFAVSFGSGIIFTFYYHTSELQLRINNVYCPLRRLKFLCGDYIFLAARHNILFN